MNLLDLPNVVLMEALEFLSYEEVAKKRLVCRRFDAICQDILNCGFSRAMRQHSVSFKRIKSLLPRRESERRIHCLARHADILTSIDTRISMLSMTYTKYIDLNLCCFIPGRVLDEIFRILGIIARTSKPLRPHEVLQELRDISSMAIEHFDDCIVATLRKTYASTANATPAKSGGGGGKSAGLNRSRRASPATPTNSTNYLRVGYSASRSAAPCGCSPGSAAGGGSGGGGSGSGASGSPRCCDVSVSRAVDLYVPSYNGEVDYDAEEALPTPHPYEQSGGCPEARATMTYFKKLEMEYKKGIVKMHRMQQLQINQSRRLQQSLNSVVELNAQIVELKKRIEDVDAKNREISANIRQFNNGPPGTGEATPTTTPTPSPPPEEAAANDAATPTTATKRSRPESPLPSDDGGGDETKKAKIL